MDIEYFKHNILPLKNKLFHKALSITESVVESQDIVQEVMMRLWDKRREWATIGNMEVFYGSHKNLALDKVKMANYRSKSIDMSEAEEKIISPIHTHIISISGFNPKSGI